jgi:hypothetical protein
MKIYVGFYGNIENMSLKLQEDLLFEMKNSHQSTVKMEKRKRMKGLMLMNKEGENAVPERETLDETITSRRCQASPTRYINPDSIGRSNILARCNYIPITMQVNDGRRIQPSKNTGLEQSNLHYSTIQKTNQR